MIPKHSAVEKVRRRPDVQMPRVVIQVEVRVELVGSNPQLAGSRVHPQEAEGFPRVGNRLAVADRSSS
jgi:hypothetical protein